ncbi:hypothetical protein [Kitasatospora sp. NPDC004272]
MRSFRRTALVSVVAGLALLTGCSSSGKSGAPGSGGGAAAPAAPPSLSSTPTPTTLAETQVLPLAAFASTPQESNTLAKATGLLTQDCMKRLGFAAWKPTVNDMTARTVSMPTPYGFLDADQAARFGFHSPDTGDGVKKSTGKLDPAEFTALSGQASLDSTQQAGGNVPPGGCSGEADRKLRGDKPVPTSNVYGDLTGQSDNRTKSDGRVVAAIAQWADCMKQRGYAYSNPESLSTESWGPTPTPREIETAKADVACTKQTNLSGIAFGVQSAIQQQLITQHGNDLKAYRAAVQDQLDKAAAVLREHGQ